MPKKKNTSSKTKTTRTKTTRTKSKASKKKSKSKTAASRNGSSSRTVPSRGLRRAHLDKRHNSLLHRLRIIESELHRLETRFYRTCIFGSARIKPESEIYQQVQVLAHLLATEHIDILTGGGPGLMEAANKGAQIGRDEMNSRSRSFGLSIELEWEPVPNQHLDIKRHHHRFSSRLDEFMRLSHSIICTPGGIGTLLELLFAWQLIQVKHMDPRPIVLMDRSYWQGYLDWMHEVPLARELIGESDFDCIEIVDTPEEVFEIIAAHHKEFMLNRKKLEEESRRY